MKLSVKLSFRVFILKHWSHVRSNSCLFVLTYCTLYHYSVSFFVLLHEILFSSNRESYMVILHLRWPPKECICSLPPLPLHLLLKFISHLLRSFVNFIFTFFNLFPHPLFFFPWPLAPLSPSTTFSSFSPSIPTRPPSLPLCAPFPSTHQSLALASPLRTYGMMDRRASGASEAKGHLPGALRCRGALGPAMQPRPHTSVSRHSHQHTQHAHSNTYYRICYLTLAPLTLIAASHHVRGSVFLMI